jgi:hypothetical protein
MALKELAVALSMIAAASPASATNQDWSSLQTGQPIAAPAGTPATLYCMHIEAITGSRLEKVKCWTREEWAENGVDVDQDWATEGVRAIG